MSGRSSVRALSAAVLAVVLGLAVAGGAAVGAAVDDDRGNDPQVHEGHEPAVPGGQESNR